MKKSVFWVFITILSSSYIRSYDLPGINLGFTNILDGGPVKPSSGWYYSQYLQYYTTNKLTDAQGNLRGNVPSPHIDSVNGISIVTYQTEDNFLFKKTRLGLEFVFNYTLSSKISPNLLNLTNSGKGLGDIYGVAYLQWDPLIYKDRPLFVHRLAFMSTFPTGKMSNKSINPGNGFFAILPYWAATLYVAPRWALSWRLIYEWSARSRYTNIQAGQAFVLNYSTEYEILKGMWLSAAGYFLQQFTDSKVARISTPGRRERVLGIGPAALYCPNPNVDLMAYLYFEKLARNRPQGINFILRSVIHF